MKAINNWDKVQAVKEGRPLPAGGYIVKIVGAKEVAYDANDGSSFSKLEIALDICEGEYAGFYEADFKLQTQEDKRWRGVLRQYIPKEDGSDQDEWTKSSLKGLTSAIEDSNAGYHWDWDETKLRGKIVGCLFRMEEWEFEGKTGWKAQPFKFIPADQVRKGDFKAPKFKAHKNHPGDTPENSGESAKPAAAFEPIDEPEGGFPF